MQNTTINLTDTQQIISAVKGRLGIGKYQAEKRRRYRWRWRARAQLAASGLGGSGRGAAGARGRSTTLAHAAREAAYARRASDILDVTTGTAARAAGPSELSRACLTDLVVADLNRASM